MVTNEQFSRTELLFQPFFKRFKLEGIDHTAFESIMKWDIEISKDLCTNIVLPVGRVMVFAR
jgi:hypothetical protein